MPRPTAHKSNADLLEEKDFITLGVGVVFIILPFYLAGKSAEKSLIKK